MKNKSLVLAVAAIFLSTLFLSCKKVNEATDLGGGLIPSVDNVNTFEINLPAETDNVSLLNDTTIVAYQDETPLGYLNDPEFGTTKANLYFVLSSAKYKSYPFSNKTDLIIDSVVLQLGYTGVYGDSNSLQTVRVYELDGSLSIQDSLFKYTDNDLPTAGLQLASKTFSPSTFKDSLTLIRKKDTTKVGNVLRIRLDNSLGTKLASFDTAYGANGGYYNDSIFQTLFKGLAVKTDEAGNALTYFNIFDNTKTKLTVYFRSTTNNVIDTSSAEFNHFSAIDFGTAQPLGVASVIKRTPGGNWATYLSNAGTNEDKLYIQSAPGSYGAIKIPGLDTLSNKTIHVAELIVYRLPSISDNIFTIPPSLYLDKVNNQRDTAFLFESDQTVDGNTGAINYIGGRIKSDETYRFNITRHVQGIATRKEPNMVLRLHAPLVEALTIRGTNPVRKGLGIALDKIANGRVVVAGGNYADPNKRLKLRIVYSKL